jgi:acyl carrier protein
MTTGDAKLPPGAQSLGAREAHRQDGGRQGPVAVDKVQLRAVLAECAGLALDIGQLDDRADLYRAGMSSHATVSVMLALEDTFDIEFPTQMLNRATFESVEAIGEAVSALLAARED